MGSTSIVCITGAGLRNGRFVNNFSAENRRCNTVAGHNALDNYAAVVVLALFHCGIVEPLIALGLGVDENNGVSPEDVNEGQDALMNLYNEGKNRGQGHRRHQRKIQIAKDIGHGLGLRRSATRLLGVLIHMASRLLPQNICRRTLADLQLLVSAGTDRNSTTSSVRHGGVDEDKYALGIGEIMGMKDEDKPTLSEKDVSRLPIDHLCVEDYPSCNSHDEPVTACDWTRLFV